MITYFASIPIMDLQLRIKEMGNDYCDEIPSFFLFHNQFNTLQRLLGVRNIIMKYGLECHGSDKFISEIDGLRKHCCHEKKKCWAHICLAKYIVNLYDITPAQKGNLTRAMRKLNKKMNKECEDRMKMKFKKQTIIDLSS